MDLLSGSEERKATRIKKNKEGEPEKQERVDEEDEEAEQQQMKDELMVQLKKLKKGKVPGEDGIENEAWRLMPKEIGGAMWKLYNNIWTNGGIPDDWNKETICPIYKKGEKSDVKNYRGITLMDTAYKIYANILNERLSSAVEEKLGEGQFGFRKGRSCIDAIYTLNFVANRELSKKEENFLYSLQISRQFSIKWIEAN